jgi:hypothetical protein
MPDPGDMAGWKGDQKVLAESAVLTGEDFSKHSWCSTTSDKDAVGLVKLIRDVSTACCWLTLGPFGNRPPLSASRIIHAPLDDGEPSRLSPSLKTLAVSSPVHA